MSQSKIIEVAWQLSNSIIRVCVYFFVSLETHSSEIDPEFKQKNNNNNKILNRKIS